MATRRDVLLVAAGLAAQPVFARAETSADGFVILKARVLDATLVENGDKTPVWTYAEAWPPPVLRARQGVEFKVRIINTLDRPLAIHWFGIRGPSDMMSLSVEPGESNAIDCVFTPPDAGVFWFGPVQDASRQREMGLTGMLIVDGPIPLPFTELAMVLDDWTLTEAGVIDEASFGNLDEAIAEGRMGNWFTVNGQYRPHFTGPANGPLLLRLLNTANVRTMGVQFKGADPLIIARDGQPIVPAPVGEMPLHLAPGQRADLLVLPGSEMISLALDLFEDLVEIAYVDRAGGAVAVVPVGFTLPPNPVSVPGDLAIARTVKLLIEGGAKGGLKSAVLNGETLEIRSLLEKGFAWAVNGVAGLGASPWATFARGETVVIEAENRTAFAQPVCIHGHVWQPLGGNGWADTAVIGPKETLKLVFVADNPGAWGLHSTIAERMDSGLFTSFTVADGG